MASIERTAYPRFRRLVTARELALMAPTVDDVAWAGAHARSGEHLLALMVSLTCFQRLGYFPRRGDEHAREDDHGVTEAVGEGSGQCVGQGRR